MKIVRVIITILIIAIVVFSMWNTIQLNRCKRNSNILKDEIASRETMFKKIEKRIIDSQIVSMSYLNRKFTLSNISRVYPEGDFQAGLKRNPKLLLIFSEFSCNVCQDNETKFAVEFCDGFGESFVLAVIQTSNKRYLSTYIRLNGVNFPVYYCEGDTFFVSNYIQSTPLVLVIDEENRVIASHFPIPGHPEYSEPIHQFCFDYFKKFKAK